MVSAARRRQIQQSGSELHPNSFHTKPSNIEANAQRRPVARARRSFRLFRMTLLLFPFVDQLPSSLLPLLRAACLDSKLSVPFCDFLLLSSAPVSRSCFDLRSVRIIGGIAPKCLENQPEIFRKEPKEAWLRNPDRFTSSTSSGWT